MAYLLGFTVLEGKQKIGLVLFKEDNGELYARIGSWMLDIEEQNLDYISMRGAPFPVQAAISVIAEKGKTFTNFPHPAADKIFVSGNAFESTAMALKHFEAATPTEKEVWISSYTAMTNTVSFSQLDTLTADQQNAFLIWLYREVFTVVLLVGTLAVETYDILCQLEDEWGEKYADGSKNRELLPTGFIRYIIARRFLTAEARLAFAEGFRLHKGGEEYTELSITWQDLLEDGYKLGQLFPDA